MKRFGEISELPEPPFSEAEPIKFAFTVPGELFPVFQNVAFSSVGAMKMFRPSVTLHPK
jgi:hypothetical protein